MFEGQSDHIWAPTPPTGRSRAEHSDYTAIRIGPCRRQARARPPVSKTGAGSRQEPKTTTSQSERPSLHSFCDERRRGPDIDVVLFCLSSETPK